MVESVCGNENTQRGYSVLELVKGKPSPPGRALEEEKLVNGDDYGG